MSCSRGRWGSIVLKMKRSLRSCSRGRGRTQVYILKSGSRGLRLCSKECWRFGDVLEDVEVKLGCSIKRKEKVFYFFLLLHLYGISESKLLWLIVNEDWGNWYNNLRSLRSCSRERGHCGRAQEKFMEVLPKRSLMLRLCAMLLGGSKFHPSCLVANDVWVVTEVVPKRKRSLRSWSRGRGHWGCNLLFFGLAQVWEINLKYNKNFSWTFNYEIFSSFER